MIIVTDAIAEKGWKLQSGHQVIDLPWYPVVFVHCKGKESYPEPPDGFEVFELDKNPEWIWDKQCIVYPKYAALHEQGPCCKYFSHALTYGGHLYIPKSPLNWFNLIWENPEHDFVLSLSEHHAGTGHDKWYLRTGCMDLRKKQFMGIWNVSPDSFSAHLDPSENTLIDNAQLLLKQHPDMLDIGGESTRPGAVPVEAAEEIGRLKEPLKWADENCKIPFSVDTRHLETMVYCLENSKTAAINDVALTQEVTMDREGQIYRLIRDYGAGLIMMAWYPHEHEFAEFRECIESIVRQLSDRLELAYQIGVDLRTVMVDPGIGFGKGLDNDALLIMDSPKALQCLGRPILIAHSRKRCISRLTRFPMENLDEPTAALSGMTFCRGASMVRVHDVAGSKVATRVLKARGIIL